MVDPRPDRPASCQIGARVDLAAKPPTTTDDKERFLLARVARQRDRHAMERLYRQYRSRLGGFLYRLLHNNALVEEVFNDVMLIVWQKAAQFNGQSKVSTWVLSIAYRHGLQLLRKEHKYLAGDSNSETAVMDQSYDHQQPIRMALSRLSFEHRSVVVLAYFFGHNYAEIAEIMGCPENTVKTRMFYAKRCLQQELAKIGITSAM